MSHGSNMKRARRSRPGLEGLEGRSLLSGAGSVAGSLQAQAATTTAPIIHGYDYKTLQGTRVHIQLYGVGTLFGTTVDPDGALNLVFSGTNEQTGIIATAKGGDGHPALRSIHHRFEPSESLSGIGSSLVNVVKLKDFNLVDGGRINLTGGVHILSLNSVGSNTQVSLREIPPALLQGQPTSTSSENGVTLGFLADLTGARTLTSTSGTFVAGFNLLGSNQLPSGASNPGPPPAPPGVVVTINHVNGPTRASSAAAPAEVYGYDPVQNALIRFDTTTGAANLSIPNALPAATAGSQAGVALGRDAGNLVVMISDGLNVYAYNPLDGSSVGHFALNTPALVSAGLVHATRLGTFDSGTVVGDATAGVGGLGLIQPIDVTRSLASGQAQPVVDPQTMAPVPPYASTRAFGLSGGMTGIPGSSTLFAMGGGHFDQYQPLQFQLGISSLTPNLPTAATAGAALSEASRAAVTVNGQNVITDAHGAHGAHGAQLNNALGSLGQALTLDTGVGADPATGLTVNRVALVNAQSFAQQSVFSLNDPNLLTGLTAAFRPSLAGVALVDVQGNTQSFRAQDAQGLVFNGEGNVNLVKIHNATDTTIVGFPFGHAQIPIRSNVVIYSTPRSVGDRNGVTVVPGLTPLGPLFLP